MQGDHFDLSTTSWKPGLTPTHKGPLFNIPPVVFYAVSGLPPGNYAVYFALDPVMNGTVDFDKLAYDYVMLYVTPWDVIGAGGRGFSPSTAPRVRPGGVVWISERSERNPIC